MQNTNLEQEIMETAGENLVANASEEAVKKGLTVKGVATVAVGIVGGIYVGKLLYKGADKFIVTPIKNKLKAKKAAKAEAAKNDEPVKAE